MEVIKFHGTKHPITVITDNSGLKQLADDPAVHVLHHKGSFITAGAHEVTYQFLDPKRAALDMELSYEILVEHEAAEVGH